jgi:hypothetical protein
VSLCLYFSEEERCHVGEYLLISQQMTSDFSSPLFAWRCVPRQSPGRRVVLWLPPHLTTDLHSNVDKKDHNVQDKCLEFCQQVICLLSVLRPSPTLGTCHLHVQEWEQLRHLNCTPKADLRVFAMFSNTSAKVCVDPSASSSQTRVEL